ncbi:MAG: hypothetical protein CUN49_12600 [Candidatus Thermofonsia Clade 1 bacterium]|uniref:SD-repeat containing protein B domain-containing protein n=1 Tax=Candidatus Thermofonsia Clade 1 bacterium TaxID=2364210 RepID=A0A2M8PBX1_9CHLR|nr:MAG: hypothetical protein CUN49_12600 [Candidatus Thermofonsia Clade 1 bacterium]RMF52435.1 MAG: hypothetical protein D6749_04925 [Chloroflexota bacterium]
MKTQRYKIAFGLIAALLLLPLAAVCAQAELTTGTVCALAYHDANQNGVRDFGEESLPEVSYNLMIASNVLVANYVALQGEPYCFENLPAQQYTLNISSPLYVPSVGAITFFLRAGERLTYEFGALYRAPQSAPLPQEALTVVPMTPSVRLGMAISASLLVMLFFCALGMIFYGLFLYRRPLLSAPGTARQTGSSHIASVRLKRSKSDLPQTAPSELAPRSTRYDDLDAPDEDG